MVIPVSEAMVQPLYKTPYGDDLYLQCMEPQSTTQLQVTIIPKDSQMPSLGSRPKSITVFHNASITMYSSVPSLGTL